MIDCERLLALLNGFHITDRALVRTRDKARAGGEAGAFGALKKEMRRYFSSLEREAKSHLSSIDAKLDDLYQRQYNLQAERGVAERRLLGARNVLAVLDAQAQENGR